VRDSRSRRVWRRACAGLAVPPIGCPIAVARCDMSQTCHSGLPGDRRQHRSGAGSQRSKVQVALTPWNALDISSAGRAKATPAPRTDRRAANPTPPAEPSGRQGDPFRLAPAQEVSPAAHPGGSGIGPWTTRGPSCSTTAAMPALAPLSGISMKSPAPHGRPGPRRAGCPITYRSVCRWRSQRASR
jgi:hypothetical protein